MPIRILTDYAHVELDQKLHNLELTQDYQSLTSPNYQSPEKKLWLKVLLQAINSTSCQKQKNGNTYIKDYGRNWREEDRYWLLESEDFYVGSYYYVCDVCNIPAEKLRKYLKENINNISRELKYILTNSLNEFSKNYKAFEKTEGEQE